MGDKSQPPAQAGQTSKAEGVAGEVGALHSSEVFLGELGTQTRAELREAGRRESAYSTRGGEAKDKGMDGATRIITPTKVRELQITLYRKAKSKPKYRFWSLYGDLLRRDVLETALEIQIRNNGEAGVDGETLESINADLQTRQQWLDRLQEELKAKRYRPSPVRRVMIPKSDRGQRPLGIPTVKDRVVQTAVCLLLMPIWEADFHPQSYGFRPKRRAHQAIDAIVQDVYAGYTEIIDADLSKYFDTIPHRELLRMVARRISDGSILRLIKSWLRAPVVEEDKDGKRRESRMALRQQLRGILNHWTQWKSISEVVTDANRVLRGWAGYFHYRNSTSVMVGLKRYSRQRLRRWIWRKHDCTHGLWKHSTDERLHFQYGLYALPTTAAWKAR